MVNIAFLGLDGSRILYADRNEWCSVWDLYEEDMQEYQAKKQEIRDMFEQEGEPLPAPLKRSNKSVVEEMEDEMDPTMKAFRAMERKLKG